MTTSAASLRSVGEGGEGTVRKRVRKDPASRRAELVRAAREVFGRSGYAETGITEIAHEAQVSKALLYHYFPDGRPQLFVAWWPSSCSRSSGRGSARPRRSRSPRRSAWSSCSARSSASSTTARRRIASCSGDRACRGTTPSRRRRPSHPGAAAAELAALMAVVGHGRRRARRGQQRHPRLRARQRRPRASPSRSTPRPRGGSAPPTPPPPSPSDPRPPGRRHLSSATGQASGTIRSRGPSKRSASAAGPLGVGGGVAPIAGPPPSRATTLVPSQRRLSTAERAPARARRTSASS